MRVLLLSFLLVFQLQSALGKTSVLEEKPVGYHEADFIIPLHQFKNGQTLKNLRLHYITLGTPQKNDKGEITNAVLFLHWTGGSGSEMFNHFDKALLASGKPFDANKYFLIFPDDIGQGQSSKPSDGLRMTFPHYGYHDMVELQHELVVKELKISHLKMIVGTSMGGMHTWLWSELYPEFMDGIMPIVCLPLAIDGRNLLWRQIVVNSIENDPSWNKGNYDIPPYSLQAIWPLMAMMVDGVPHMQRTITNLKDANSYILNAKLASMNYDANDIIYVMSASQDYNPEALLPTIKAKVFALDFTDDAIDSPEFHRMPDLIKRVKYGKWIMQKGTPFSYGHFTLLHPELWVDQAGRFVQWVDSPSIKSP
ncbi:Homoserine O-acetyltransferase [Legionella massiliensis]|uniref:Homoserine O-acetyltransferase n=1 Tax=Legionella massiliensis TaxID=1034943 RepID=A0A078KXT1_9GAMM|nr:alpha/beta fold hydrolase [Legionella massiliensis]CDZ77776.1 Homoserine O-acetyltransferase [Legionella massiliensis]CEE13514.1 Homoserine O-acetyltransferase [Legionella massiliensis]